VSEPFAFWVFLVILFGAAAVIWAITGRVARRDDDLAADERALEADWISDTIGRWGGDVPVPVVTQVLDLHRRYLDGPGFDLENGDDGEAKADGR
jgi:transposase InsO family protein